MPAYAPFTFAPGYAGVVLSDMPVAYWRLGESAGATKAQDSSGRNVVGTYTASPTRGLPGLVNDADAPNACAKFTAASSQYVDFGTPAILTDLVAMSFEFWFKRTTTGAQTILYKSDNNTSAGWWVDVLSSNDLGMNLCKSTSNVRGYASAPTAGVLTHVVITFTGGNTGSTDVVLYYNGVAQTQISNQTGVGTHTTDAAVSCWLGKPGTNLTSYMNSTIDEVAIYNRVLSPATVKTHYLAGLSATYRPATRLRPFKAPVSSTGTRRQGMHHQLF